MILKNNYFVYNLANARSWNIFWSNSPCDGTNNFNINLQVIWGDGKHQEFALYKIEGKNRAEQHVQGITCELFEKGRCEAYPEKY